jgi:hypothetical protein
MCGSQVSCEQHLLQKIDYDKTAYEEMSQPTSKNHIEDNDRIVVTSERTE